QNIITAEVQIIEPLGDRMDVYLDTPDGTRFIANIDPHIAFKVGDSVRMHIDVEKIHIFELGDIGRNITLN
ncbi:MAG: TOBE domain-containing protein, partial [Actinobacteria bacterium]|nr:TOBE domain-containing protein [Actinomycetota bacterium]